jgi:hypothetical protein
VVLGGGCSCLTRGRSCSVSACSLLCFNRGVSLCCCLLCHVRRVYLFGICVAARDFKVRGGLQRGLLRALESGLLNLRLEVLLERGVPVCCLSCQVRGVCLFTVLFADQELLIERSVFHCLLCQLRWVRQFAVFFFADQDLLFSPRGSPEGPEESEILPSVTLGLNPLPSGNRAEPPEAHVPSTRHKVKQHLLMLGSESPREKFTLVF